MYYIVFVPCLIDCSTKMFWFSLYGIRKSSVYTIFKYRESIPTSLIGLLLSTYDDKKLNKTQVTFIYHHNLLIYQNKVSWTFLELFYAFLSYFLCLPCHCMGSKTLIFISQTNTIISMFSVC